VGEAGGTKVGFWGTTSIEDKRASCASPAVNRLLACIHPDEKVNSRARDDRGGRFGALRGLELLTIADIGERDLASIGVAHCPETEIRRMI
jgi:hypothetical protein